MQGLNQPHSHLQIIPPSSTLEVPAPWSGRFWARSVCSTDSSGKFICGTGNCGSGQIACAGAGAMPPATLVEFTLAANGGADFYDVSLVDGFNLPVSVIPQGGSSGCNRTSCPANVNANCPPELSVRGSGRSVIACKSACLVFNKPEYCCTGAFGTPSKCPPTNYSRIFKNQCPQAYSYAYDDKSSTFTCSGRANYAITFCP
ncbi:Thaumatin [Quillaja saponaria]|uniref:Thaumatin n=1 Tax=Quillaja saponaria TaxID=32244 RepID=A0AAD7VMY3_QUISA|nr:Thaumatin [Quillaja saponaria]